MTLAPSLPQVMEEFAPAYGTSAAKDASFEFAGIAEMGSFSVTVYMIGLALGLLLFGSLSDVYGRLFITRSAAFFYTVASIACALSPTLDALIAFRAVAGFFGGAAQVIGGSVVADLYPEGKRDTAVAWYTAGPVLGPALGSVVGSLINSSIGWRWVFWFAAILVSPASSAGSIVG
jgi:MFS family permease